MAIQTMEPPTTYKKLSPWRVFYIRNFIPALVELFEPFYKLLKKSTPFWWCEKQQKGFLKVKKVVSS